MEKRGLILVVGATGSGKSTSLAAMLDLRNEQQVRPHPDPRGPDRVHLQEQEVDRQPARSRHRHQELRDRAEERAAPGARLHPDRRDPRQADHGHGARLRAVRPPRARHAARQQQLPRDEPHHQLLPAGEPAQRCCSTCRRRCRRSSRSAWCAPRPARAWPAVEVLLNTRHIAELIEKGDINEIKEAMEKSMAPGSQTFEQALFKLFMDGLDHAGRGDGERRLADQHAVADQPGDRRRHHRPGAGASPPGDDKKDEKKEGVLVEHAGTAPPSANFKIDAERLTAWRGALELAQELIARRSVTPDDGGCQALHRRRACRRRLPLRADALRRASATSGRGAARPSPLFCFAGHTDVVPTGPLDQWHSDPFVPTHARRQALRPRRGRHEDLDRRLRRRRRGVSSKERPDHAGSIALLLTSDEEGPAVDGTVRVVEALQAARRNDRLLHRRRADLGRTRSATRSRTAGAARSPGELIVRGMQGHVAYPQLAQQSGAPARARRSPSSAKTQWDRGNEYFPPTTFQVSNIHAGTGAGNVIPGTRGGGLQFPLLHREHATPRCSSASRRSWRSTAWSTRCRWVLGARPFLSAQGQARADGRRGLQAPYRAPRRALDHRRHVGCALHHRNLPGGARDRPGQRQHPQAERAHRGRRARAAARRSTSTSCAPCFLESLGTAAQDGARFARAKLHYGHGTHNAREEAAWLISSVLGFLLEQELNSKQIRENRNPRAAPHPRAHPARLPAQGSLARRARLLRGPARHRAALVHRRAAARPPEPVAAARAETRAGSLHRLGLPRCSACFDLREIAGGCGGPVSRRRFRSQESISRNTDWESAFASSGQTCSIPSRRRSTT